VASGGIGIIANPASGKDVRRLVARASVFDNAEKRAIVRRALTGIAANAGSCPLRFFDDGHGIVRGALADSGVFADAQALPVPASGQAQDTTAAAGALRDAGCAVVITLGGDGTNRAVVRGWQQAPLIAISTGTNNVFPSLVEATIAGAAAGLIAAGRVALDAVAARHKLVRVEISGEHDDLALIDAVLTSDRFVGARALLEPERLRTLLLTRAEPAAIGMTALGGLLEPVAGADAGGLLLELGPGGTALSAPIAPGHYRTVAVRSWRRVGFEEVVEVAGPGVVALDGERERPLQQGQPARLRVVRTGPMVVDVAAALRAAARDGHFRAAQETQSVSS